MNHVVSFVVVLYVTDVWGEEFCSSVLAVLPYLLDGHVIGVDFVTNASGIVILSCQIFLRVLGTVVMVVEAHNIAVRCDDAGMLLVLPSEVIADWFEEVLLHLFRPSFRIADDPVQFSGLIIDVYHGIDVTSGEG